MAAAASSTLVQNNRYRTNSVLAPCGPHVTLVLSEDTGMRRVIYGFLSEDKGVRRVLYGFLSERVEQSGEIEIHVRTEGAVTLPVNRIDLHPRIAVQQGRDLIDVPSQSCLDDVAASWC